MCLLHVQTQEVHLISTTWANQLTLDTLHKSMSLLNYLSLEVLSIATQLSLEIFFIIFTLSNLHNRYYTCIICLVYIK